MAVFVLFFLAASAMAEDRFITIKGEAKTEIPPDFVSIDLTILAKGPDLAALKQDVDRRTGLLLTSASELGIPGTDIESSGVSVSREYESDRNANEKLRGYEVSRNVSIKLRELAKYEGLAQEIVDAGVDEVSSVDADVDDRSVLKQRALVLATRNARNEAQAVADELGVKLSGPIEVSEERLWIEDPVRQRAGKNLSEVIVTAQRRAQAMAGIVQVVFQPQAIKVEATVWARFAILDKASP
jgi:uncharacterized protein YggE